MSPRVDPWLLGVNFAAEAQTFDLDSGNTSAIYPMGIAAYEETLGRWDGGPGQTGGAPLWISHGSTVALGGPPARPVARRSAQLPQAR
jgi:hypothetical protein